MRYQMEYLAGNSHLLLVTFLYLASRRAALFAAYPFADGYGTRAAQG